MPELSRAALTWQKDADKYLQTGHEMSGSEQLRFMTDLLGEFDLRVPALDQSQLMAVSKNTEANPAWRLVPTPLANFGFRRGLTQPSANSSVTELLAPYIRHDLWLPSDAQGTISKKYRLWNDLWQDDGPRAVNGTNKYSLPDESRKIINTPYKLYFQNTTVEWSQEPEVRPYGLRYKTSDGKLRSRSAYIKDLLRGVNAVRQEDTGLVWTFPLMEIENTEPNRSYVDPKYLFEKLDPTVSPEARLGAQVLHIMAGKPLHPDITHVINEVVAEVDPKRGFVAKEVAGFSGVTRSAIGGFLRQGAWSHRPLPDWQEAGGSSALAV